MSDLTERYDGTLDRTPDGGVIRFERHLPYRIDDVWEAITEPARLADWWLPFDAEITVDLRVGGEMVFTAVDGDPPPMVCTIMTVEPPTLLEHTHVAEGSWMRWELEGFETGCILRLTHFVTDVDAALEHGFVVGLQTSLDRLGPLLAGDPVPWDWGAFADARRHYAERGLAVSDDEAATPVADER